MSSLGSQVRDTVFDGGVYDGITVEFVGNGLVVSFEEVLIDAVVFVKEFQRGFEALREAVNRGTIEALVVNATYFEDDAELPRLREEDIGIDKPIQIHLLVERARLLVILENPLEFKHC